MRFARLWVLALALSCYTTVANELVPAAGVDVGGCLLLFGAYANGNMGDVVQSSTMQRLFTQVAPEGTCIWHSHPSKEDPSKGFHEGTRKKRSFTATTYRRCCVETTSWRRPPHAIANNTEVNMEKLKFQRENETLEKLVLNKNDAGVCFSFCCR